MPRRQPDDSEVYDVDPPLEETGFVGEEESYATVAPLVHVRRRRARLRDWMNERGLTSVKDAIE